MQQAMEAAETIGAEVLALRPEEAAPVYGCAACRDTGMVLEIAHGVHTARQCVCVRERVARRRMERAGIPRRYEAATLANFRTVGLDPSVQFAARMAAGLVLDWPGTGPEAGRGLLLAGMCGVGKTHLAVGLLRELVARGASGRFWDLSDLLVQLKRGYGQGGGAGEAGMEAARSESAVYDEVTRADVLVLDELGAQRQTEWSFDAIALLLGARYNASRLTVITTNFPNLPPGAGKGGQETLGDRIGARMHSRLQEMCRPVEMLGVDMRVRRAR